METVIEAIAFVAASILVVLITLIWGAPATPWSELWDECRRPDTPPWLAALFVVGFVTRKSLPGIAIAAIGTMFCVLYGPTIEDWRRFAETMLRGLRDLIWGPGAPETPEAAA